MIASPQAPLQVVRAVLTTGAGVEPRGPAPHDRFELEVRWKGPKPAFRVWRLHLGGGPAPVTAEVHPGEDGTWILSGTLAEPFREGERMRIEVWKGRRRLAHADTDLERHFLPAARPRQEEP